MKPPRKILVCGIGNTLRGDDGAGIAVAEQIAQLQLQDVTVETRRQLQPEMAEYFPQYDIVLVADASVVANEVEITKATCTHVFAPASSHHINLTLLNAMAAQLYGKEINLYSCAVPAAQFEIGENFSAATAKHVKTAVQKITQWLQTINNEH